MFVVSDQLVFSAPLLTASEPLTLLVPPRRMLAVLPTVSARGQLQQQHQQQRMVDPVLFNGALFALVRAPSQSCRVGEPRPSPFQAYSQLSFSEVTAVAGTAAEGVAARTTSSVQAPTPPAAVATTSRHTWSSRASQLGSWVRAVKACVLG